MDAKEWRYLQVPEDAAEGGVCQVPVPPKPWRCEEDMAVNAPDRLNCQMCGRLREDVEL